jgi:hypothetical protein
MIGAIPPLPNRMARSATALLVNLLSSCINTRHTFSTNQIPRDPPRVDTYDSSSCSSVTGKIHVYKQGPAETAVGLQTAVDGRSLMHENRPC